MRRPHIPSSENRLRNICDWPDLTVSTTQTSTFVDVRRVHSLYLHSDFGDHNCVAPTGVRNVLAKIPVSVGYGGLAYVEAGTHALSSVRLSLHDAAGRPLDLKGTSWSCTLIFAR